MNIKVFQKTVWNHYKKHGRDLPWRRTTKPYRILVSEIMLQQTQVDRVIPKYKSFVKQFPSFRALGRARKKDVLIAWQGLGYNRRALNLYKTAQIVSEKYHGKLPRTHSELVELPGIGSYTASAIRVFAYNIPDVMIETNIRTVFIRYYLFKKALIDPEQKVHDKELLPLIKKTLPADVSAREWYYALMDYGTYLKKTIGNKNKQSKHYTKQSKFEGSNRQLRGQILKILTEKPASAQALTRKLKKPVSKALTELKKEGFIKQNRNSISLP